MYSSHIQRVSLVKMIIFSLCGIENMKITVIAYHLTLVSYRIFRFIIIWGKDAESGAYNINR